MEAVTGTHRSTEHRMVVRIIVRHRFAKHLVARKGEGAAYSIRQFAQPVAVIEGDFETGIGYHSAVGDGRIVVAQRRRVVAGSIFQNS